MDLLKEEPQKLYRTYLLPSLGSAMVMSIYTMADAVAVGNGIGPIGISALSITTPLLCLLMCIGLLFGIGGASLMSIHFGTGNEKTGRQYFTLSFLGWIVITGAVWLIYGLFMPKLCRALGATGTLYPYVMDYMQWIIRFLPFVPLSNFLAAFIRNDQDPRRAMAGVICGGVLNIILDYLLVFPMQMGMAGAALASMLGMLVSDCIMLTHFFGKKNRLRFTKITDSVHRLSEIFRSGTACLLNELSNGIIVCLFNLQSLKYGGESALSVYGVISYCAILFYSLFSGVGQSIQPLISLNFGAGLSKRIGQFRRFAFRHIFLMGALFVFIGMVFPHPLLRLFTTADATLYTLADTAFRLYFPSFFFMGINLLTAYYFQSILRGDKAMVLSLLRSVILSCAFLWLLPRIWGLNGMWCVMLAAEGITAGLSAIFFLNEKKKLQALDSPSPE